MLQFKTQVKRFDLLRKIISKSLANRIFFAVKRDSVICERAGLLGPKEEVNSNADSTVERINFSAIFFANPVLSHSHKTS